MICLWYRSRFRHKAGWLHTFLSSQDHQAAVGSLLQMEAFLPNTSLLLNALRKNDLHEVQSTPDNSNPC